MNGLLASLLLVVAQQGGQGDLVRRQGLQLHALDGGPSLAVVIPDTQKLDPTKRSPKNNGQFLWQTNGFGRFTEEHGYVRRVQVYAEDRGTHDRLGLPVAQMVMRLWEHNLRKLKIDQSTRYNYGIIDLYLCSKGKAGGEQRFDTEIVNGEQIRVNTIYVYDVKSFDKNRMEMAREIAHEYGHATLPPIGGFETPEDWANGYLGEKMFLRWCLESMKDNKMNSSDVMGATRAELERWVAQNVDPLLVRGGTERPTRAALGKKGREGMNAYLGLALYVQAVFPGEFFSRAHVLGGSQSAPDFIRGIAMATAERESLKLSVPAPLRGKAIWVPYGDKTLIEGAKVLQRAEGWAKVQPSGASFTLHP